MPEELVLSLSAVRDVRELFEQWTIRRTNWERHGDAGRNNFDTVGMNELLLAFRSQAKPLAAWAECYGIDASALRTICHDLHGGENAARRAEVRTVLSKLEGAIMAEQRNATAANGAPKKSPELLALEKKILAEGAVRLRQAWQAAANDKTSRKVKSPYTGDILTTDSSDTRVDPEFWNTPEGETLRKKFEEAKEHPDVQVALVSEVPPVAFSLSQISTVDAKPGPAALPNLNDTDKEAAKYIRNNPGCKGESVASEICVTSEHFRSRIVPKLKAHGYYNRNGYRPPKRVKKPAT